MPYIIFRYVTFHLKNTSEFTKFITVYNETIKIVVLSGFEDLCDRNENVYKYASGSSKRFKVTYEEKDMEEYVDLDSPIQLMMDTKSNKLYIKSEKMRKIMINLIFLSLCHVLCILLTKIFTFCRHNLLRKN